MEVGQKISFTIYDNLFKDFIRGTGKLKAKFYGKLWTVIPDRNPRLSGNDIRLHENSM